MSSIIFFFFFIPLLSIILLSVNFIFAPHKPYKEKKTPFECGYHSFSQTRSQFSISFFLFAYVFLLLDIEIILLYPYPLSAVDNTIYGLFGMIIFTTIVTVGFVFELGKEALKITSKQYQEFPPDPYGFVSMQKLSIFTMDIAPQPHRFAYHPLRSANPFIWADLTEEENMKAILELSQYLSWAINSFHEAIIEYDFIMKPNPSHVEENSDINTLFTLSDIYGNIPNWTPYIDCPMWGDKLFAGPEGKYFWLSHYKNNNMGVPYTRLEYPLIKTVYINYATGLDHQFAPVHAVTRNWHTVDDKIRFINRGIHAVSAYFEIIKCTVQNIDAHILYGRHIVEQWEMMDTHDFLNFVGLEDDETDINWEPHRVDLLSIMEKQGFSPENEAARQQLRDMSDNATSAEIKSIWLKYNSNILTDLETATREKCALINKSRILSELAMKKMDEYNHTYSNWPHNPPVERLVEFTSPSPFYRSTIFNSISSPRIPRMW